MPPSLRTDIRLFGTSREKTSYYPRQLSRYPLLRWYTEFYPSIEGLVAVKSPRHATAVTKEEDGPLIVQHGRIRGWYTRFGVVQTNHLLYGESHERIDWYERDTGVGRRSHPIKWQSGNPSVRRVIPIC